MIQQDRENDLEGIKEDHKSKRTDLGLDTIRKGLECTNTTDYSFYDPETHEKNS